MFYFRVLLSAFVYSLLHIFSPFFAFFILSPQLASADISPEGYLEGDGTRNIF
jgi:hypothetical protein